MVKGDWSVAPYYNFGTNSAGAFLTYNIIAELGTYISSDKALTGNTGTYALGFTTPILEDYIQGYVEIGGTYGDDATAFFGVGLYFNILKSVKILVILNIFFHLIYTNVLIININTIINK